MQNHIDETDTALDGAWALPACDGTDAATGAGTFTGDTPDATAAVDLDDTVTDDDAQLCVTSSLHDCTSMADLQRNHEVVVKEVNPIHWVVRHPVHGQLGTIRTLGNASCSICHILQHLHQWTAFTFVAVTY